MERRELLIRGGATLAGLMLPQNLPEEIFAQNISLVTPQPIVGAIRWDGWFANNRWQKNLQNPEYANRLPFYASKNGSEIIINGNSMAIMEKEIEYANQAGLDYWSFCYYHPMDWEAATYNYGYELYKQKIAAQPSIKAPNFALNLQGMHVGTPEKWGDFCNFILENTLNDHHQKTQTGRPLINMYYVKDFYDTFGGVDNGKRALDKLRNILIQNNANPLIVAQNAVENDLDVSSFDAVGAYTAINYQKGNFPYNDLGRDNIGYCNYYLRSNKIVVPTVNAGWNPNPRLSDKDWAHVYERGPLYDFPTPDQLRAQMLLTKKWLAENQTDVLDKIILIYAWNEFDEGGFLVPTKNLTTGAINRGLLDSIR